jgi:release factor glutamine methyltransferase
MIKTQNSDSAPVSYQESIDRATKELRAASIETPRLDAEILLQHALSKNRIELYLARHEVHNDKTLEAYKALVNRRRSHEPVAYICGHKEFFGYDFLVNSACLIPRPDTEIVVEQCLRHIALSSDETIFDLCTGSGIIAITLLKERPLLRAIATDISNDALKLAHENAKNLKVDERLAFGQGDLFAAIDPCEKASLIVSNPPYVRAPDIDNLASSVRDFEPHIALDGGKDGLDFYRRILKEAPSFLRAHGHLICEIGFDQASDISALIDDTWIAVEIIKDLGQRDRCIVLQLRSHSEKS